MLMCQSPKQGYGNARSGRKPVEAFVPWKKPTAVHGRGEAVSVSEPESSDIDKEKGKSMSRAAGTPILSTLSISKPVPAAKQRINVHSRFARREGRQSESSAHAANSDGDTSVGRLKGNRRTNMAVFVYVGLVTTFEGELNDWKTWQSVGMFHLWNGLCQMPTKTLRGQ